MTKLVSMSLLCVYLFLYLCLLLPLLPLCRGLQLQSVPTNKGDDVVSPGYLICFEGIVCSLPPFVLVLRNTVDRAWQLRWCCYSYWISTLYWRLRLFIFHPLNARHRIAWKLKRWYSFLLLVISILKATFAVLFSCFCLSFILRQNRPKISCPHRKDTALNWLKWCHFRHWSPVTY